MCFMKDDRDSLLKGKMVFYHSAPPLPPPGRSISCFPSQSCNVPSCGPSSFPLFSLNRATLCCHVLSPPPPLFRFLPNVLKVGPAPRDLKRPPRSLYSFSPFLPAPPPLFSKRSKISLGSKALSHDSVFVSDSSEANEALGASQDSIHGKVKSLQVTRSCGVCQHRHTQHRTNVLKFTFLKQ